MVELRTIRAALLLVLAACALSLLPSCDKPTASPPSAHGTTDERAQPIATAKSKSVPKWLGKPLAHVRDPSKPPVVLFDSFHAHNFLHRGLVPGEHSYHHITGLRRAAKLLEARGCQVRELLIGPLTTRHLADVQLVILNLPSIDRPPWLVSEIAAIEKYIRQGGGIIFVTDHSNCYYHQYHLLPLWDRLGLTPTFETVCERKADCKLASSGSGWILVRDFESHPVTAGVRHFAMQTGGRVTGEGVVAWTSDQAWADVGSAPLYGQGSMGLFGDMRYSDSEEQGKQGIVLARGVGLGRVAVIGDQNSLGDAFVSYADNWRLWLSACKWCGQLDWDDHCESPVANVSNGPQDAAPVAPAVDASSATETAASQTAPNTEPDEPDEPDEGPNFSELIAGEPDRNAPATMSPDAWAVHCWEPFAGDRLHWGGTDPSQYYYFWSWMNRWFWVAANDQPQRPREHSAGRPMLLAVDSDIDAPELVAHARQTLAQGGKVILLPEKDGAADGQSPSEDARQTLARAARSLAPDSLSLDRAQWADQPLPHWHIDAGEGTLVIIASAHTLRNASFSQPEISPGAAVLKWENELRQWLFEQP